MHYEDKSVGDVKLPEGSPAWLSQLTISVAHVSREDFLANIERLVDKVKSDSRDRVIAQTRQLVADYGLVLSDVFPSSGQKGINVIGRSPVAPKYRDPASGKTWTGRGHAPHWIAGKDRDQFRI